MNSDHVVGQYLCLNVHHSIAGLWSALVAADHFEDVLIIEPEAWLPSIGKSNQYDAEGLPVLEEVSPQRTRVAHSDACHGQFDLVVLL